MAVARWLKAVSKDESLIGKSSGQGTGGSGGRSSSRVKELESQNQVLQGELTELKEMMQAFMLSQSQANETEEVQVEEAVVEEAPKKPRRKSRAKKK